MGIPTMPATILPGGEPTVPERVRHTGAGPGARVATDGADSPRSRRHDMARPARNRRVPTEIAERLRIAAAAATEQVLDLHVRSALEVVSEGGNQAPVDRLLGIYARLHHLQPAQEWRLRERVLASLGRDVGAGWTPRELAAPRSLFRRIARRVRGRVHHELREWLDLHTARVELELIELHLRHALVFVRLQADHAATGQAVQTYARMLELRSATAELVRLKTLVALGTERLPGRREPDQPTPPVVPLRLADGGS